MRIRIPSSRIRSVSSSGKCSRRSLPSSHSHSRSRLKRMSSYLQVTTARAWAAAAAGAAAAAAGALAERAEVRAAAAPGRTGRRMSQSTRQPCCREGSARSFGYSVSARSGSQRAGCSNLANRSPSKLDLPFQFPNRGPCPACGRRHHCTSSRTCCPIRRFCPPARKCQSAPGRRQMPRRPLSGGGERGSLRGGGRRPPPAATPPPDRAAAAANLATARSSSGWGTQCDGSRPSSPARRFQRTSRRC